jgi:hypothetical protein
LIASVEEAFHQGREEGYLLVLVGRTVMDDLAALSIVLVKVV